MKYFLGFCLLCLTGCLYKMPNANNVCTLPNTNNPLVTHEKPHSYLPGKKA